MLKNRLLFIENRSCLFISLLLLFVYLFINKNVFANESPILSAEFSKPVDASMHFKNDISEWEEIEFEGATEYKDTGDCISAISNASASGLIKEIRIKLKGQSVLRWGWTAEQNLSQGKAAPEKSKAGDDFLARVYVIHEGRFPWQTKAINYVWSREHAVEEHWPNPFLSNARMIVVQSGKDGLGEWRYFERNIKNDFEKYFNINIDKIDAIALMTDTDNTKGKAAACYQLPILVNNGNAASH